LRRQAARVAPPRHNGIVRWASLDTPIGPVSVGADERAVRAVHLGPVERAGRPSGLLAEALDQVRDYFAGTRDTFDLPVADTEGSDFARAVRAELLRIPYGQTRTYGQVADAVGEPGVARAVGTACHRNPLPLLVPCHRVVGAGGKLVGFGAGLPRKRWLLEHEAKVAFARAWR
jgi:methylated-DNA-[protein]-cysteine S-methyltransferase